MINKKVRSPKVRKYKVFNVTREELNAILAGSEQISADSEAADENYREWGFKQMELINSFYKKVKIQ